MNATIQSVTKVGEEQVSVGIIFADGSLKDFQFSNDIDEEQIKATIKEEVERLKTIDGKVSNLQKLVGITIE